MHLHLSSRRLGTLWPFTLSLLLALSAPACGGDSNGGSSDKADAGATDGGADGQSPDATGVDGGGGTQTGACADTPKPSVDPGAAVCSVEKTGKGLLIVADVLLPGKVIEGGAVLLDDKGQITCVGCDCVAKATDATWVICPDAVVSPGLIDAHNHVGWLNGKPWVASEANVDPAQRWEHRHDWRKGKRGNAKVTVSGGGAGNDQKAFGELRYVLTGSTAIFGSGDLSGLMRDLDSTGSGKNGLNQPGALYNTFPLGDSGGEMLSKGCAYPSIANSPGKSTDAFAPHVAEGIDAEARNEFLCMTGQGQGAAQLLDQRAALIHAVGLNATDMGTVAAKGMDIIWSPRSNVSLYGDTARVTIAHRMGVSIGLGADWVPSGSVNMLRELQCAAYLNDHHFGKTFSDDELWQMATIGGARALAMDDAIGLLKEGYAGDLAVYRKSGRKGHSAVVGAKTADVALVMRGGVVLAGNLAVIEKLDDTCETLGDVCGVDKGVCVKKSIGKTYKELLASVGKPSYPMFFCDIPTNEPSCVPARTLKDDSIDGSGLYAGMSDPKDKDGDGIENDKDNCPDIFNPVRPNDGGVQPDTDGDKVGDVCDVCPLDADTDKCKKFDPNDPDGDGVPSTEDNCPDKGNSDQGDKDSDGKGDVCDPCPDYKNPGSEGCLVEVTELKTKPELMDQRVAVKGLVVTAAANGGVFCQKNGKPAVDHGGIYIYMGSEATLPKVGEVVDILGGTLGTYYNQKQLTGVEFKVTADKGEVEPRLLDLAAIKQMAEKDKYNSPHDGLLIAVKDALVTNDKPTPGAGDAEALNEIEIEGGLRIDDAMWPAGTDYIKPLPVKGAVLPEVVGPVTFRNDYMKLLPRGPQDFTLGPPEVLTVTPAKAFQFEGVSGPIKPEPITVTLDHPGKADVTVEVSIADATIAEAVGGPFVIKAGEASVAVDIKGLKVGSTKLSAMVKDGTKKVEIDLQVLDPKAEPAVTGLTPNGAKLGPAGTQSYTVTLSSPAPQGGASVKLALEPADLGTLPEAVTVTAGDVSATFAFKAGSKLGKGKLTASTSTGSASVALEVADLASLALDMSGWSVVQTDGAATWKLPAGTTVPVGGYLVIGRDATQKDFEAQWKVTLGKNVVYLTTGSKLPVINGKETYTLKDASGKVIDGPTVAVKGGGDDNYQRVVPVAAAGEAASWKVGPADPGKATPGSGQGPDPGWKTAYISEFSDSLGTGKYVFEFVEIYNP